MCLSASLKIGSRFYKNAPSKEDDLVKDPAPGFSSFSALYHPGILAQRHPRPFDMPMGSQLDIQQVLTFGDTCVGPNNNTEAQVIALFGLCQL